MDSAPVDQSIVIIVIGPAILAALAGALIYWMRRRGPPDPPARQ